MEINKDTRNENLFFETDDVSFTSFLLTQKIRLIDIQQDNPRHFLFILSDFEKCLTLKSEYLNGASAPAWQLFSEREKLISEMKNKQRNG